jgi:hypothetical protein
MHEAFRTIFTRVAVMALATGTYAGHAHAQVNPLPAGGWDYQLAGRYPADDRVTIISSNAGISADPSQPALADQPVDTSRYNICYLNVFQTQPDDNQYWWDNYPQLILADASNTAIEDTRWRDEFLFDISTEEKRAMLLSVQQRWLEYCRDAGFQAVEPDNIDSYERSDGLLGLEHALAYQQQFSAAAHALGLAVAQKNVVDWVSELAPDGQVLATAAGFDFAIVEECQLTGECDALTAFYGASGVLEVEYWYDEPDNSSGVLVEANSREHFDLACSARGSEVRIVLRNRDVRPSGSAGFVFDLCGATAETPPLETEAEAGPVSVPAGTSETEPGLAPGTDDEQGVGGAEEEGGEQEGSDDEAP